MIVKLKTNLLKSAIPLLIITFLCTSYAKKPTQPKNYRMMLYGVAYNKVCGTTESYAGHSYKLIYVNDYNKNSRDAFEAHLKEVVPNAFRYRISTSKFDFGPEASHMCIIKWSNKINKCNQEVVSILFEKSEEACYNKAVKHKNLWAHEGSKTEFVILESKNW